MFSFWIKVPDKWPNVNKQHKKKQANITLLNQPGLFFLARANDEPNPAIIPAEPTVPRKAAPGESRAAGWSKVFFKITFIKAVIGELFCYVNGISMINIKHKV